MGLSILTFPEVSHYYLGMHRLLLSLFLIFFGACASAQRQPLSQLRGTDVRGYGVNVEQHYVGSQDEAMAIIARKQRYLKLLFEQHTDGFGNPILSSACVAENKIYPIERVGDQIILLSEVHVTDTPSLNIGACPNVPGVGKAYYIVAYCPKMGAVLEVKLRQRLIRDPKRLNPCD